MLTPNQTPGLKPISEASQGAYLPAAAEVYLKEAFLLAPAISTRLAQIFPELFDSDTVVRPFEQQGLLNETFVARNREGREFIVQAYQFADARTPAVLCMQDEPRYQKQQFWMQYARTHVPELTSIVAEPIGVTGIALEDVPMPVWHIQGVAAQVPYYLFIQTRLPGASASQTPVVTGNVTSLEPINTSKMLEQLGHYMKLLNSITPNGVGHNFDKPSSAFTEAATSQQYIEQAVVACNIDFLVSSDFLSNSEGALIKQRFANLLQKCTTPSLAIADMNYSNILLNPSTGQISGLVDWETVHSIPSIDFEFALKAPSLCEGRSYLTANDDFTRAFVRGYGISFDQFIKEYAYDADSARLLLLLPGIANNIRLNSNELENTPNWDNRRAKWKLWNINQWDSMARLTVREILRQTGC